MLIATCCQARLWSHTKGHLGQVLVRRSTGAGARQWQAWLHAAPLLTHPSIALHRCSRGDIFGGRCLSMLALNYAAPRAM